MLICGIYEKSIPRLGAPNSEYVVVVRADYNLVHLDTRGLPVKRHE